MTMKIAVSFLALAIVLFPLSRTLAVYDPLSVPNNKYGIHIADINDVSRVQPLVNSSGGQWGYVTFVIEEGDRDIGKWQTIFRQLRRLGLLPIVRIATHVEAGQWVKPTIEQAISWASFLGSLPWPSMNRYVIIFNEPNHAKEWGGEVNPQEYGEVLLVYGKTLKEASRDFFILPAGLDASAPNSRDTMDESVFLTSIVASIPSALTAIDGWTSHSYPNPGFSGSPYARGRGTLTTYEWELTLLKELGFQKELPVFITETGWAHNRYTPWGRGLSPETVGDYIRVASEAVWNDPRIVAVTPFVFQYPEPLFAMFSWLTPSAKEPYPQYEVYRGIAKISGDPMLTPSLEFLALLSRPLLF